MTTFIETSRGILNLQRVQEVRTDEGYDALIVDGKVYDDSRNFVAAVADTLVNVLSVAPGWSFLTPIFGPDGYSLSREAVLAWGLTARGILVPVTASMPRGAHYSFGHESEYGLQGPGDARVTTPQRKFESELDWLQCLNRELSEKQPYPQQETD